MEKWVRDAKSQDAHDREGILHGLVEGSPRKKKKRREAFNLTQAFLDAVKTVQIERQRRGPITDSEVEGLPGTGFGHGEDANLDLREMNRRAAGATITKSGMPAGRNPHVGLHIPAPTAAERAARRRALRQRRGGTVRPANRR
jgi:hypothetical protein